MSNKEVLNGARSIFYKAEFFDGSRCWIRGEDLKSEDPFIMINHAYTNGYHDQPGFEWIPKYLEAEKEIIALLKIFNADSPSLKKYKFGVEVPRNKSHALQLDKENGNNNWLNSIKLELKQIMDYEVFKILERGERPPPGYKRIPYSIVFDVKFDGRLKSRLVAGGHRSPDVPKEESYSGVVSMEGMRLGFALSVLNDLTACAGDVGNAFCMEQLRNKCISLLDWSLDLN